LSLAHLQEPVWEVEDGVDSDYDEVRSSFVLLMYVAARHHKRYTYDGVPICPLLTCRERRNERFLRPVSARQLGTRGGGDVQENCGTVLFG
jgi:hypothetical protein